MLPLSLAISPCPNDTLMFDALVNNKISPEGMSFHLEYHDIEELNSGLQSRKWDIAKMSIASFPLIQKDYVMLSAGMAMGFGNGPLIVSPHENLKLDSFTGKMLIPGFNTTANLLLSRFYPGITNKEEVLFSEIITRLEKHEAEAGLIIHESRFTYHRHKLHKLADMGELWFAQTGLPLPLGVIVARRSLGDEIIRKVENLLRRSIEYGLQNRTEALPYIRSHAKETADEVINNHIDLYVNPYSVNPGSDGIEAVLALLRSKPENHSLSLHDIFASWVN